MSLTSEQQAKLEEALIIQKDYLLGMANILNEVAPGFRYTISLHIAQYLQAIAPIWIAVGYEYKLKEIAALLPKEYQAQLRFLDSGFTRSGF